MSSGPALAITQPDGSRKYVHPISGEAVPSVTTVIKTGFPKPMLTRWAARKAAEYAVANWDTMQGLSVTEKVDQIRCAPERIASDAADIGNAVHEAIDKWSKGEAHEITKSVNSYVNNFLDFLFTCRPKFIENEVTLWSRKHGYAGTADWIAEIDGLIYLGDNKTGKRVYEEAALQLSALAGCDFLIRENGTEEEIPEISVLAALHIRPRSWKLIRIRHQEECFTAFLAARETMRWTQEVSPHVLGC